MHRDIASPLLFLPLKLGGLGVGSAVQRHAAASWRAWQSIIPTLRATTQSPDTDSLFSSTPQLRAQLTQLQSTLSQQMNKPTFQLKPLGAALRLQTTEKKQVSTIQRNIHKQFYNSLTDTPTEQAILLSQSTSHTGAHLMQPSSEAYEVEDRCFRVSVARRLMLPHPAVADPAEVVQFCPDKKYGRYQLQQTSRSETSFLLQSVPGFCRQQQNQDMWPRERRRANLTGTHTSISFLSFLRPQASLVHMPRNSLTAYCEMLITHQQLSETLGPPSKVSSTVPSPNNNSRQPLRDS